jgi:hypothetical protein
MRVLRVMEHKRARREEKLGGFGGALDMRNGVCSNGGHFGVPRGPGVADARNVAMMSSSYRTKRSVNERRCHKSV